jgi:hypothetical protein
MFSRTSKGQLNDPPYTVRQDELTASIATRLRNACSDMSDVDFAALVRDIARMAMRFRQIDEQPHLLHTVDQSTVPIAPPLPPVTEAWRQEPRHTT